MAGEEEISTSTINLITYPNPFESTINVHINSTIIGKCTIRLMDQMGRIVKIQEVNATEISQNTFVLKDLENLNRGMYILEIETETEKIVKKIVRN